MVTVKQVVAEYCNEPEENITNSDIIEVVVDCGNEVWADSYIDEHRWYSLQEVVVEIAGHYIAFQKYMIQGDNGMRDMDLEYSVDDFALVEKKTRVVTETYYETIASSN